jgi:hypothetical protein
MRASPTAPPSDASSRRSSTWPPPSWAPTAAGRFRRQLRDVEGHPQLWALTLAFALRGELLPADDDDAPADIPEIGPPGQALPATADALLAAFRAQLAVIRARTQASNAVGGGGASEDAPGDPDTRSAIAVERGPAVAGARQHNVETWDARPLTDSASGGPYRRSGFMVSSGFVVQFERAVGPILRLR